jgi:hypothetical protein
VTGNSRDSALAAIRANIAKSIAAKQVVPDGAHWTIDVPDASVAWNPRSEPVWKCMHEPWSLPFSPECMATTDLAALRGGRITEACRRAEQHWELFTGTSMDIVNESKRDVSLATLLMADASLLPVTTVDVGTRLRRSTPDAPWASWQPA